MIFFFVSDYDNEHETKGNKNKTGLKKFKPQSHIIIQWQGALWCNWMVIIIVLKHILRVQYYLMESIKCPNDKMIAPLKATSEKATNELGFSQNYLHPKVTF